MNISKTEMETKDILRKYGIVADKRLGQNFLIDDEAIEQIVTKSNITKDDLIIEVGPGLGTLTNALIQVAGKVICIELDRRMIGILENRFSENDNIQIINSDILKVNLQQLISENNQYKNVKVVANLPYYITTPIIMKFLEEDLPIDSITIMIQKEVADRIVAKPGGKDFGVLTLSVQYYSNPEIIVQVPNTSFLPVPSVNSTVIKLNVYKEKKYHVKDEDILFSIIKAGFAQRRKLFVNAVESILNSYKISKEEFVGILNRFGIGELQRAETLGLEDFAKIANEVNYLKICRK